MWYFITLYQSEKIHKLKNIGAVTHRSFSFFAVTQEYISSVEKFVPPERYDFHNVYFWHVGRFEFCYSSTFSIFILRYLPPLRRLLKFGQIFSMNCDNWTERSAIFFGNHMISSAVWDKSTRVNFSRVHQISSLWKIYECWFIPNCTKKIMWSLVINIHAKKRHDLVVFISCHGPSVRPPAFA